MVDKHKKDKWFLDDFSVNPYSGCSFNCSIATRKYGQNSFRKNMKDCAKLIRHRQKNIKGAEGKIKKIV